MGTANLDVADGVARITWSNPGRRNAFTWTMYEQLKSVAIQVAADPNLHVVVLQGQPGEGFAAGTDITQFPEVRTGEEGVAYERRVGAVLEAVAAIPVPVVALVEGVAVGAGLALASLADLVVAERGSRFGAPIVRTLGNCLPALVLQRLRLRVGTAIADRMLLGSELIAAEELTGFVSDVVDPGGLDAAGDRLVRRLRGSAPLALRALKLSMRRLDDAMPVAENDDMLRMAYGSDDFAEGVRAFLAHDRPTWRGR